MTGRDRPREGPLKQDLREECLRMDVSAMAEQHETGEREERNKKAAHECFDDRVLPSFADSTLEPVIGPRIAATRWYSPQ